MTTPDDLTTPRINVSMARKVWPDDYEQDASDDHGIRCPKCNCPRTRVTHTRHSVGKRNLRRRECENCGYTFPTYERTA
jgi:transposase-like protein